MNLPPKNQLMIEYFLSDFIRQVLVESSRSRRCLMTKVFSMIRLLFLKVPGGEGGSGIEVFSLWRSLMALLK